MTSRERKSDIMFNIFKILHRHSDVEHRLTQKEIIDKLKQHYEMKPDRKVIRDNIFDLEDHISDFGFNQDNSYKIEYSVVERKRKDKETGELIANSMYSNFYMEHLFTKGELSLLIDGLLFSKQIDLSQRKMLVKKLETLSSKYFKSRFEHIRVNVKEGAKNKSLFMNIEDIDDAINQSKQISFTYNRYQINKKLQDEFLPQLDHEGNVKKYTVNPYQIVATNGRYYLMANHDRFDNVIYYRLDRMTNIKILKTQRKPIKKITGWENDFKLAKHMLEQVYMYTGESASVTLRLKKVIISDFIDWFGPGHQYFDETEDSVSVTVDVNENAMRKWALQYGLYVRVLSPAHLVTELEKDIKTVMKNYQL